jgi:hypothetical protein
LNLIVVLASTLPGLLRLLLILVTMPNLMVAGYVTDNVCLSTLHLLHSVDALCYVDFSIFIYR